jgi:predicted RNA methylase
MPTATRTVNDLVLDVLSDAVITGTKLVITNADGTPRQLDRAEYVAVDKVLKALGGKWNRSAKGHLWPVGTDVAAVIEPVLLTGTVTDQRKQFDVFYTPPEIAAQVIDAAGIGPDMNVLEPSAGDGALALAARAAGAYVVAVELRDIPWPGLTHVGAHPHHKLYRDDRLQLWTGMDFLTWGTDGQGHYNRVVMNPPFSNQQDMAHVRHAAQFVRPGGRLVAIMSPAFTFRTGRTATDFRAWLDAHSHTIVDLPDGSFKAAGTAVRTVMVTIDFP